MAKKTSDLDRIREDVVSLAGHQSCVKAGTSCGYHGCATALRILALLDGAVGLTRPGDVVLSAEQAALVRRALGIGMRLTGDYDAAMALLASGRPGEEQA